MAPAKHYAKSSANENEMSSAQVIKAGLLIPGRGEPSEKAAVVIEAGKIKWVGPEAELPSEHSDAPSTSVPYLLPGLWDCHVHFLGVHRGTGIGQYVQVPQSVAGARSAHDAAVLLQAGFTSVRDLAGYGAEIAKVIDEGVLIGPNIYSAVSAISQTGGHGDGHELPLDHFLGYCQHGAGAPFTLSDGRDECRKAVRLQLRRGAKVIKICASGGVLSLLDHPIHQQFSDEEMAVMVEEASRADRVVAAHCHGKVGIMAALKAGCKTIEHGTYADEEVFNLVKEKGAIMVMTRSILHECLNLEGQMPPESFRKMVETAGIHERMYREAVKHGVRMALGSDYGVSDSASPLAHGNNGTELAHAVAHGMTPLQAIECATANAPATLGPQAPKSGIVKEGYDADFIALASNPLQDIHVLKNRKNVTHVWKAGKLYKENGKMVELT